MEEMKKPGIMDGSGEWDEEDHPRDEDGKFTSGGSGEKSQRKSRQSGAINSGASGALDSDSTAARKHAEVMYEEIRKRKYDVKSIAKNVNYSEADIQKIKNHMFTNKYDLDGGYKTFDPDYNQAVSWQRLADGKDIHESDKVLLQHELYEQDLMINKGMSYEQAHKITNQKYNYRRKLEEEKKW